MLKVVATSRFGSTHMIVHAFRMRYHSCCFAQLALHAEKTSCRAAFVPWSGGAWNYTSGQSGTLEGQKTPSHASALRLCSVASPWQWFWMTRGDADPASLLCTPSLQAIIGWCEATHFFPDNTNG